MGNNGAPPYPAIELFVCPTFTGGEVVDQGNTEYAELNTTLGLTNYMALTGTHIDEKGRVVENGMIVSVCAMDDECKYNGHTTDQIGDGWSNTILLCESREPQYAAWTDSQATWVVGIDAAAGISGVGTPDVQASAHFINVGGSSTYLTPGRGWGGKAARQWGPSSEHTGDVVVHAFTDNHTRAISQNIDPTLYYKLITRNGGEAVVRPR